MNIVIFDLDDTLADFTSSFCEFINTEVIKREHLEVKHTTYGLLDPFPEVMITPMEALRLFESSNRIPRLPQRPKLVEHYMHHYDRGDEIHVVTARGWMRSPVEDTASWFDFHKIPQPSRIKVVSLTESKAQYVEGLYGNVTHIFEDSPSHLEEYYNNNPKEANIVAACRLWNTKSPCHFRISEESQYEFK